MTVVMAMTCGLVSSSTQEQREHELYDFLRKLHIFTIRSHYFRYRCDDMSKDRCNHFRDQFTYGIYESCKAVYDKCTDDNCVAILNRCEKVMNTECVKMHCVYNMFTCHEEGCMTLTDCWNHCGQRFDAGADDF